MDKEVKTQATEIPAVSFDEFPPTSYEAWKAEAVNALKGAPFEKRLFTKTYEGITLEPIYTTEHTKKAPHSLEYPGKADYVRGTNAAGYIGQPWIIAQASDGILPAQTNETIRRELSRGSQAINIKLDKTILNGREDQCYGHESGLYLSTLQDMDDTLQDITVGQNELHIFAGVSAAPILGLLAAQARAQGQASLLRDYSGCVGADPIGVLAEESSLPCILDQLYDEMALTIQWSRENMPWIRTIFVRGDSYHNGGANAIQEVAYCMSTAIAYISAMQIRGLDIDTIAGQIRFGFSLGANFFMEIAKLRAARMLWAQIIQSFGGGEEAQKIDIFARTSHFTQTTYDPYVNILRATSQAFSGVVGGVGTMQVAPFDEVFGQTSEQSRRVARNIQLMFQNEFDLTQPIDPAGGSWYIESLTQQIADEAWAKIQDIAKNDGMIAQLQKGNIQEEIKKVLNDRLKNLATRSDRAVGSNMYANMGEKPLQKTFLSPEAIKDDRAHAMQEYLSDRDEPYCQECLKKMESQISGESGRFMQALIEAFMAGAMLEEVRHTLNDGFPSDIQVAPITPHRWTEQFEALREGTERYQAETGCNIRVFLANLGPIPQHKPRAEFSIGFFEVGHFEMLKNDGFATVEEAARAAAQSQADVTVICSTDETYPELVPPLAKLIKSTCPDMMVLLAGAPAPEFKDAYLAAGVDDFIHVRANCLDILSKIQKAKGIC